MSVQSHERSVYLRSLMLGNSVPDPAILVKNFNVADFVGKWFVTSGLKILLLILFDCQLHKFHTESNKLVGNLSWRIRTPDTGFFTRSTVQRFVQDPVYPAMLYNHDNEFLHNQDWLVISFTVKFLPESIVLELEMAAKSIGRDFNKFISTDNKGSWRNRREEVDWVELVPEIGRRIY